MPIDLVGVGPFQDRLAGELGAVVADDAGRLAIEPHQRVQFASHPFAPDAGVADQAQVLTAAVVVDRQNAELARGAEGGVLVTAVKNVPLSKLLKYRC